MSKKEWKWQRGLVAHLLVKADGTEVTWESEKLGMQVEGFRGHDGSLLGKTGKWRACGRAVVQPDYDEEMGGADCFHIF